MRRYEAAAAAIARVPLHRNAAASRLIVRAVVVVVCAARLPLTVAGSMIESVGAEVQSCSSAPPREPPHRPDCTKSFERKDAAAPEDALLPPPRVPPPP